MRSDEILASDLGQAIVDQINDKIAARYKMRPQESRPVIENLILGNKEILALIEAGKPVKQITKSKAFKSIQSLARKKIYYQLRQYNRGEEEQIALLNSIDKLSLNPTTTHIQELLLQLADTHVSTKERLDDLIFYQEKMLALTANCKSVIDIGCGIAPVIFPFYEDACQLESYLALEKDPKSIRVLESFRRLVPEKTNFEVRQWNISDDWVALPQNQRNFDLALLFKVVPVVKRNEPDLLSILEQTPAAKWLISGSRIAMAKKEDIERRERRIIQSFIQEAGKEIIDEFSIHEEFFLLVE